MTVSSAVGFIKGKRAIYIARNFVDESFCARGFYVSTVGLDKASVREYIKHQEKEGQRID